MAAVVLACGESEPAWSVDFATYGAITFGTEVLDLERITGRPIMDVAGREDEWCDQVAFVEGTDSVHFMVTGTVLQRVDVDHAGVMTTTGITVGSPVAAVYEAYPQGVTVEPHRYRDGQYLIVAPSDGDSTRRIVFEVTGDTVLRYRAGVRPYVEWVEGCS